MGSESSLNYTKPCRLKRPHKTLFSFISKVLMLSTVFLYLFDYYYYYY